MDQIGASRPCQGARPPPKPRLALWCGEFPGPALGRLETDALPLRCSVRVGGSAPLRGGCTALTLRGSTLSINAATLRERSDCALRSKRGTRIECAQQQLNPPPPGRFASPPPLPTTLSITGPFGTLQRAFQNSAPPSALERGCLCSAVSPGVGVGVGHSPHRPH